VPSLFCELWYNLGSPLAANRKWKCEDIHMLRAPGSTTPSDEQVHCGNCIIPEWSKNFSHVMGLSTLK
jgi:hypothetical protein